MICRFAALCAMVFMLARPALAQPDVISHIRADRWPEAAAAAAQYPDPIVGKLVTFYRLMAPGAANAADISAFQAANPDWPLQASLSRRRDEALAGEADDATLRAECVRTPPQLTAALLHCAETLASSNRDTAARLARLAWIGGITEPAFEQRFLHEQGALLTRADHAARFDRLAWSDPAAATRQIPRLDAAERPRAEARLAFRRDDPNAARMTANLSAADRADPGLFYEQAGWLRRTGQDEAARDLWIAAGAAAERAAPEARDGAFWGERNIMARRRLRQGDAAGAYAIAAGYAGKSVEQAVDALFLAGFIALGPLADPARAGPQFRRLADLSKAAITQGRAHYWLGRTAEVRGNSEAAQREYEEAAKWPNTFYGQLAALRHGDTMSALASRITATTDPMADGARAVDFSGRELARAAAYLVSWGEPRRAQPFLLRLDDIAPDAIDRSLAARLAIGFNLPETAVALARRAGRDGIILLGAGWPQPFMPPTPPEIALSLGIMRQESSFDPGTVSPAGARGLMQLMRGTAAQISRKLSIGTNVPALVLDPNYNMRLGTAYLRDLLDQYAGAAPLAIAAYNAGPGRVNEWMLTNGDPRTATVDMIGWIELIPFGETRNYVQRVIENQVVYQAKRNDTRPHPLAPWLH